MVHLSLKDFWNFKVDSVRIFPHEHPPFTQVPVSFWTNHLSETCLNVKSLYPQGVRVGPAAASIHPSSGSPAPLSGWPHTSHWTSLDFILLVCKTPSPLSMWLSSPDSCGHDLLVPWPGAGDSKTKVKDGPCLGSCCCPLAWWGPTPRPWGT